MLLKIRPRRTRSLLLALSCLCAAPVNGADETSFFENLPVVLTVSRLPQAMQDTPGAVTVIDESLIAATGYRDLARLLRLVPGMQVGQERGNDQWVTYHGLGADYPNQMQVLVDGRSVYSPYFFGGADWGALPVALEDIERIEIVRGSDSAAYGSNAFLGVVNILTRHTAAERGSSVSASLGGSGIADATARAVGRHGPLGLRITAQQVRDRGMDGVNDHRELGLLNLRADLRLNPADELTAHLAITRGRRAMGYPGTLFDSGGERTARHHDSSVHLRWRHAPSDDEEWSLSYYHSRERTRDEWFVDSSSNIGVLAGRLPPTWMDYLADAKLIPVDNNRDSRRDNLEFQHHFRSSEATKMLWGAELRRDWLDAPFLFHGQNARSQREWRVFTNLEWRITPQWLSNAGLMVEHIEDDRLRLAPRLFVNWQPSATQTWRLGWSRAWRQPSLFERGADVRIVHQGEVLNYRHLPNPDIRPQRIDALEVGFLGRLDTRTGGSVDVRLFHERIRDLVQRREAQPDGSLSNPPAVQAVLGSTRWENLDSPVRLTGIEYQLRAQPWRDGELIFNHTMIHVSSSERAVRDSVAPYSASLTWLQRHGPWEGSLSVMRMGPIDAGSGYAQGFLYKVPAYTTLDASLGRQLNIAGIPVEVRLSGINLLGRHQELAYRPLQFLARDNHPVTRIGRQIHLSARATF
ncbi:TonB-dependent receptor [Pseudothauera nasutitermitis]|uniref:TonB-dependent receptor n=1 Tax=Pseudothauera nasutitermitis TaxID=2565930 RepID=A0A4V3WBU8_9RHOO|nr:TonB-dependent receptor [Pseudothauera nasutitermitis]THF64539.1 TonB-dependent receptor [Pseudothauera nasutitermitis]